MSTPKVYVATYTTESTFRIPSNINLEDKETWEAYVRRDVLHIRNLKYPDICYDITPEMSAEEDIDFMKYPSKEEVVDAEEYGDGEGAYAQWPNEASPRFKADTDFSTPIEGMRATDLDDVVWEWDEGEANGGWKRIECDFCKSTKDILDICGLDGTKVECQEMGICPACMEKEWDDLEADGWVKA